MLKCYLNQIKVKSRTRECTGNGECPVSGGLEFENCDVPDCPPTCAVGNQCPDENSFCDDSAGKVTCLCKFPFRFDEETKKCSKCIALRPFSFQCQGES